MNDSNLNYNNSDNTYRATTNFNTALENLNADNINSATEVNVLGPEYSNGMINYGNDYSTGMINQGMNVYNNVQNNDIGFQNSSVFMNDNTQVNNTQVNGDSFSAVGLGGFDSNQINQPQNMGVANNDNNNNQFINKPLSSNDINNSNSFLGGSFINPQAITNSNADVYMGGDAITTTKKKVTYEPILETKKKPSDIVNTGSAKEGLVVIIISLVLIVFVFAMPYIYDFFREVWLSFVNR